MKKIFLIIILILLHVSIFSNNQYAISGVISYEQFIKLGTKATIIGSENEVVIVEIDGKFYILGS